jgi:N-acetylglucosaminyldiphosphoundecaprenol N-acetyl-beta-D-mannosaminyltransferase
MPNELIMIEKAPYPQANVLGTVLTTATFEAALNYLAEAVEARRPVVMSAATVYSVMIGHSDPTFQARVNRAEFVMTDGMPLVWAARMLGHREAERIHGDDFMMACCKRFPEWRLFLLGGLEGQPERAAEELKQRFPGVNIVGCHATPVRPVPPDENARIIEHIHQSDADMIWVGMGTPAQDVWMADNCKAAGRPMTGVGSAFDLLIGRKSPPPEWIKRIGLQWAFRLIEEPRRLARRYIIYNPLFMLNFGLQLLGLKKVDA